MRNNFILGTTISLYILLFTGCNVVKHSVYYPAYLNAANIEGTKAQKYSEKYGLHDGYLKIMEENEKENELKNINSIDEAKQLDLIKNNALLIERINKPSESLQLEAVKQHWSNIRYINNPTNKVKKEAFKNEEIIIETIKTHPSIIRYVENPTENMQIEAVKKDGLLLEYIKNPTENVQLEAVSKDGLAIKYIENPSELIKNTSFRNNWRSIQYIKDQNESLQIEAVKKYWEAIKYIKNPTYSVKLEASKNASNISTYRKIKDYILLDKNIKIEILNNYKYSIQNLTNKFIDIKNISFYYGKDFKGNDIYTTGSFSLPPNSSKEFDFNDKYVIYDKGPYVNFGFAVNYSIGSKNLEIYKVNKYLISEFIHYSN